MNDKLHGREWIDWLTRTKQIQPLQKPLQGFTLIEMLVVISIAGILAAIATPSWLSWRNEQQISAAQDQVLQILRQAQSESISSRQELQVSFREAGQGVQWATHPIATTPAAAEWESLPPGIQIDTAETTLSELAGVYRVEFTHRGHINPPLGRITFMPRGGGSAKRCIVFSTVLGAMRKANSNSVPDENGRYCY